jgi:hypothetical protein
MEDESKKEPQYAFWSKRSEQGVAVFSRISKACCLSSVLIMMILSCEFYWGNDCAISRLLIVDAPDGPV